jgi:hypothetical protein
MNKEFYGKFSYPWPPNHFPSFDSTGMTKMLNQDIGNYCKLRILPNSKIWVAGFGTNKALLTALKSPHSEK